MRNVLAGIAAIAVLAAAALFVRTQPADTATVFRSGSHVVARTSRLYLRVPSAESCRVPTLGGHLLFDRDVPAADFTVHVRFTYAQPMWCAALQDRVADAVAHAAQRLTITDLLDHRRDASDRIAAAIQQELRTDAVSARVDLPSGFERLRPVAAIASRAHAAKPVIFIGLDGADWELLDGYMASGAMPNLQRLVSAGVRGPLATEMPPLSPIVWTTMMTGVSPLQHQILDFTRFNPFTHLKEPITSDERRAPAIWNMLTYAGKSAAVFGLWATYAAEPVRAINVSDRLFTFLYSEAQRPAGVVYPPQRQRWAEERVADAERTVDVGTMRRYLPALTDAEFAQASSEQNPYAEPIAALRRILIETEIYRRVSLDYLRSAATLPDLTIIYFQGTDTIGHVFAPYAPPKQPNISQADYDRYSGIPEKYFRSIDTIIGDYLQFGATIVIASDHGFRWHEGRPTEISSTATATAAKWHRNHGIFVTTASGIAPPHSIREICRVLRNVTGTPEADYAPVFQRAPAPPAPANNRASDEDLAKLRALGYIGSGESTRSAVPQTDTKTAGAYNNAGLILRDEHRIDEAIASFDRALQIDPRHASAMWNLSETLFDSKRDLDRSDALLIAALQNGLADAPRFVITRSIAYHNDRSLRLLEQAAAAAPNDAQLRLFRGRYRLDHHDCAAALADFIAAEQNQPANALAFASAALAQMCLGDASAARASFARAHALDPTLALPH